uniref:Cell cycle regulator Mat89Bb n=1 Tax=Syphacia muris TaxID=451379 RepID=A0A0N5ARV9_9BILA
MLVNQLQSAMPGTQLLGKRKNFANGPQQSRKFANLFSHRQELASLMGEKNKWLDAQRKASLLIPPYNIDQWQVMSRLLFATLYHKVVTTALPPEQHDAQLKLLEQIIQESIIIEWPKTITGLSSDNGSRSANDDVATEIDFAPLIHRARNVVKCRTPHPTMRVRVCALSSDECCECPPVKEAFFCVTLVKLSGDASEFQVAGKLILTQREGTPATKCQDQNGATMTSDGRLIASQAALDVHSYALLENSGETGKTTPLKYELDALCATFPEMGVTLNSMVDRRQLATRYAMQVDVAINIDNILVVKHVVQSHPFLIAITNDQTEPLLVSIFWQRLLNNDQITDVLYLQPESSTKLEPPVPWKIVKQVLKNFVKAQYPPARSLCNDEILHLQSMLFFPRVARCGEVQNELNILEMELFGNISDNTELSGMAKLCQRLGQDPVADNVTITKSEFMQDKCISLADSNTQLRHSIWQWLYRATEMIMDVGHKLCPSPVILEKKCSKTKRQMAAAEEYQTMLSLFNSRTITFISSKDVEKYLKLIAEDDEQKRMFTKAIIIRFCDENAGYLSFAFSNSEEPSKPLMGSMSAEQIKDFKQGLPEFLFDEAFPKQFDKIVRSEISQSESDTAELNVIALKKRSIFNSYNTLRLQNDCIQTKDNHSIRINPSTGERLTSTDFNLPTVLQQLVQPSLDMSAAAFFMAMQNLQNRVVDELAENVEAENSDTPRSEDESPLSQRPNDGLSKTTTSRHKPKKAEIPPLVGATAFPQAKMPLLTNCINHDEPLDLTAQKSRGETKIDIIPNVNEETHENEITTNATEQNITEDLAEKSEP